MELLLFKILSSKYFKSMQVLRRSSPEIIFEIHRITSEFQLENEKDDIHSWKKGFQIILHFSLSISFKKSNKKLTQK